MRLVSVRAALLSLAGCMLLAACSKAAPEGPGEAEIQAAARAHLLQQLAQSGVQGEERAAYAATTFSPGARCVAGANAVYTCQLEATMALPGEAPTTQPMPLELVQRDGKWQVVAP